MSNSERVFSEDEYLSRREQARLREEIRLKQEYENIIAKARKAFEDFNGEDRCVFVANTDHYDGNSFAKNVAPKKFPNWEVTQYSDHLEFCPKFTKN